LTRGVALDALGKDEKRSSLQMSAQAFRSLNAPFLAAFAAYKADDLGDAERELLQGLGVADAAAVVATRARISKSNLTPREWDVARLVGSGSSNRQAAEALFLSERTVEVHVSNIFGKLQLASRAQLVRWFMDGRPAS
jgi:DNA-binding NarL/FixJ family response regulator